MFYNYFNVGGLTMRKIKKKLPSSYNKLYPILLFIATLFMGLGYASLNPANLTINFLAQAIPQNGVFISDSIFNSSDEGNFKIVSTISSNTGVFENVDSILNYTLSITNNNGIPVSYDVICDSTDAINCTGGVRGVVIPAYGTSNVSIDLRTVNGYVYRGDIHSIDVILKLVSPTEVEVNTYQIAVDSYGSTLNEIITLYNPITTTPSFSENVTTKDSS